MKSRVVDVQRIRKISPLGMRVLIQLQEEENQTEAGLYLPEGAKDKLDDSLLGTVIEVASAIDEDFDEEANISGIPLGATVIIPKDAGTRIPWDQNLRIVETADILALVKEIKVS